MLFNPLLQIAVESWGAVVCILFSVIIFIGETRDNKKAKLLWLMVIEITILLISDSLAIYYRGDLSNLGYYMVRISNGLCFLLNGIVEVSTGAYLKTLVGENDRSAIKHWDTIAYALCMIHVALLIITQFNGFYYYFDEYNRYHRGSGQYIPAVIEFVIVVLLLYVLTVNYKDHKSSQIFCLILLSCSVIVSEIIQVLFYGISLVYICLAVGMMGMMLNYQRDKFAKLQESERKLLENKVRIMEQEKELSDKSSKLMLSQIQPHFIFNTLSAISTLCVFDPDVAKKTTDTFATYLRRNLDSLGNTNLIPFSQELEHAKAYLDIEKVRFEDDLNVVYDIQYELFKIPPLTLQPMVENAVRHGIRGKEDGGTVYVTTMKDENCIRIIVKDDGIGFDQNTKKADGKVHVGVENVTERIKLLCNGTLTIESKVNVGTTVTIELPIA